MYRTLHFILVYVMLVLSRVFVINNTRLVGQEHLLDGGFPLLGTFMNS